MSLVRQSLQEEVSSRRDRSDTFFLKKKDLGMSPPQMASPPSLNRSVNESRHDSMFVTLLN